MPSDWFPLWISLKTAGLATVITFCLGIAAAYWMLGYRGRWKSLIEGIFISPLILPPTVVGFLLLLFFGRNGPFGQVMQSFNFTIVFTWYAAVITATVVAFPLMYRTTLGAFEQTDSTLLQAARTLGATEWRIFWRILLPLSVPGILAGTILAFARALGEFGATLMLAGNIPGQTQTLPMAIYFAVEAGAMNEAWQWVAVIMLISLSAILAVNGWQNQHRSRQVAAVDQILEPDNGLEKPHSDQLLTAQPRSTQPAPFDPELVVDIEKSLVGFQLKVAFVAKHQVGILGGSGAGKSMLLRCIAGVEAPQGRIVLNGRTLFDAAKQIDLPSYRRNVGVVFQNYALFPHLTVAQNIAFGLQKLSKSERSQRVAQQLAALHLQGLEHRYPQQLSGGQQQRVALARALVTEPEALLLDEPFSALDTHLRSQLEQQLRAVLASYQGVTLFVTHNLEEAYRICDQLLVMHSGQVIAHGAKQTIFERPASYSVARLTGCKNFSRAVPRAANLIEAIDWNCHLHVLEAIPARLSFVGIRAHHIRFIDAAPPEAANTVHCWLAASSETPHRVTLYLKLQTAPHHANDYHLQAEVYRERWATLKDQPLPWLIQLEPVRLMMMQAG